MKIILESKYEKGDVAYIEAYGINTYRVVKILEVSNAENNKSFIYKIAANGY